MESSRRRRQFVPRACRAEPGDNRRNPGRGGASRSSRAVCVLWRGTSTPSSAHAGRVPLSRLSFHCSSWANSFSIGPARSAAPDEGRQLLRAAVGLPSAVRDTRGSAPGPPSLPQEGFRADLPSIRWAEPTTPAGPCPDSLRSAFGNWTEPTRRGPTGAPDRRKIHPLEGTPMLHKPAAEHEKPKVEDLSSVPLT
jgi:hypothetical protein